MGFTTIGSLVAGKCGCGGSASHLSHRRNFTLSLDSQYGEPFLTSNARIRKLFLNPRRKHVSHTCLYRKVPVVINAGGSVPLRYGCRAEAAPIRKVGDVSDPPWIFYIHIPSGGGMENIRGNSIFVIPE